MTPTNCKDSSGKTVTIDEAYEVGHNTKCTLNNENGILSVSCFDGVLYISSNEDINDMRIKRGDALQGFTVAGAAIGSAFGPVGGAVGAGIGLVIDIFCFFFCRHDDRPPPNNPPTTSEAVLNIPSPIQAKKGKSTAIVTWITPIMSDKEDGNIRVVTLPANFQNGDEYSEGNYVVYFVGTDSGGLSAQTHLLFQVKVDRCRFPRWPENGFIHCESSDIIYGTTCSIRCKSGYTLYEEFNSFFNCCKNGEWVPPNPPNCEPLECVQEPIIEHGEVQCVNGKKVFDNLCEVVCNDGYQVHGKRIVGCDTNGMWGRMPVCKDIHPPRFLEGECPDDMQVYIDSANNTAKVKWDEPQGEDNSNEAVTITEIHGYRSGDRFDAGSHTFKYIITDKEQNRGDSCVFTVQVLTLSCAPPNLPVAGGKHLRYDCLSYNIGAECSMTCMSGYPMGGENKIQCSADNTSNPPKLDWKWQDGGLAPFCKETNCSREALNEPVNGALACSQWSHGQMCQMQCGAGYDIPYIGDGLFVCGRSTGTWRPYSKVPDCNKKLDVNNMNLPNEFYYYTDKCNSSIQNLNQIRENFVQALNISKFMEECIGVPTCHAKFVDVTCGPVTSRRKRDFSLHVYQRSVSELAYILQFEFVVSYIPVNGKSSDEIFAENEDMLYKMSDIIQKEVDSGSFDLHIGDLRLDSDSYGPGIPSMVCPSGTFPRKESASCVGCPKGNYAKTNGRCVECPLGTYQNKTNSLKCEDCPPNTNTTETGSENIFQCFNYCAAGEFSANMLAPCTKCPCNSFQPKAKSYNCTRCPDNKRSQSDGATSVTQCQKYDVQLSQNKATFVNNFTYDVISIFMWVYITNDQTDSAIEIENIGSKQNFIFKLTPTVSFKQSLNVVNIDRKLQKSTWTSVALTVDKMESEVTMYINGNLHFSNVTFDVSKYHVLENDDFIRLYGDIKISAFSVIPKKSSHSEISSWADSCSPSITGAIFSMDDLAETGSVRVINPSVCDAINECTSSPCGRHKCINKPGYFVCLCSDGYTGKQCQIPPDHCKNNNCKNGATCVNGTGNYTCECPYSYRGDICEIKAVDGDWSEWSNWTRCSKSCSGGTSTRTRRCDSPPPDVEGKQCRGNSMENASCNEEKCPECISLRRTYGLIITCNKIQELQRCSINCRVGLYFTNPPLQNYECGLATGYKWNHQNEENPSGRLPSCSKLEPPLEMGMDFEGTYDSIPCTDSNKKTVKDSVADNLSTLSCKKTGICETSIKEPVCASFREKRSTESFINVFIRIHASVNATESSFDISGLLENKTVPSKELTDFVKLTLELEKSVQTLMNHSVDFFKVTVDGANHSLSGSSQLTYKTDILCQSGTVRFEVFCAVCPAGSYSDDGVVKMCPKGQYQDDERQTSCKQCPPGHTTSGIGSIYVSECFVDAHPGEFDNKSDDSNFILIGISVSVTAMLVVTAVGVSLTCKRFNKKKNIVRDGSFDFNDTGYCHMPSKPLFESKAL